MSKDRQRCSENGLSGNKSRLVGLVVARQVQAWCGKAGIDKAESNKGRSD